MGGEEERKENSSLLFLTSLLGLLRELVPRPYLLVPRVKPAAEDGDPDRRLLRWGFLLLCICNRRRSVGEPRCARRPPHLAQSAVEDDLFRAREVRPAQEGVKGRVALGALGAELVGRGVERSLDRVGALGLCFFSFFFLWASGREKRRGKKRLLNFDLRLSSPFFSPPSRFPQSRTSSRTSTIMIFLSAASSVERSSEGVTRGSELGLVKEEDDDAIVVVVVARGAAIGVLLLVPEKKRARSGALLLLLSPVRQVKGSILSDTVGDEGRIGERREKKGAKRRRERARESEREREGRGERRRSEPSRSSSCFLISKKLTFIFTSGVIIAVVVIVESECMCVFEKGSGETTRWRKRQGKMRKNKRDLLFSLSGFFFGEKMSF